MTVTISRLYDNYADAQRAVQSLENAGVPHSDISIVANNSDNWYNGGKKVDRDGDGVDDRAEGAGKGAGIGAGLGGAAGLLAGLGLLAIPGLGPVVAAGWLAATAVGAAAGAATGGIVGALTEAGVSKEDATLYAEGVRRGGTLVSARVADTDRARLDAILKPVRGQPAGSKCGMAEVRLENLRSGEQALRCGRGSKRAAAVWCWNSLNKNERPASAGRFHRAGATACGGKVAEYCSTDRAAILPVLWLGSTQPDRAFWIDCLGWPSDGTDVAAAP